jgi:GNAT superfamily N-acetyltransferase
MMQAAEIVEATTTEYLDHVRSLIRDYQSQLPPQYCFPNDEWLNLPGEFAPPNGALLLVTFAGQPAGCVGLRPFPLAGACEMKRLYVRPVFRGAKLGEALVVQIIDLARRRGYSRLRLDTHPETMQAAVRLYGSLGFREIPAEPAPYVKGLSYMELHL